MYEISSKITLHSYFSFIELKLVKLYLTTFYGNGFFDLHIYKVWLAISYGQLKNCTIINVQLHGFTQRLIV